MHERPAGGRSIVTRRAIVDIVQTAVQSSYGVTGLTDPSFLRRIQRWLGLAPAGIRLRVADGLDLDLYVTVAYGVPVAEVARQVDSAVRYALRRALGVEASCVSIHVDGLRYQPTPTRTSGSRADRSDVPDARPGEQKPAGSASGAEGETAPADRATP